MELVLADPNLTEQAPKYQKVELCSLRRSGDFGEPFYSGSESGTCRSIIPDERFNLELVFTRRHSDQQDTTSS